jgi:predicted nuclease of predicted toxin-antitoxin system
LKLLLDEMYSPALAAELRARGHDVVSPHDSRYSALAGASDDDVLAAAQIEGRVLVTENVRDFRQLEVVLLSGGRHHAGLVYTSNRSFPRGAASTVGRLVSALDNLLREDEDLGDRSIFLRHVSG